MVKYIPTGFSAITVALRRIRYQCIVDENAKVLDGFIRDDPGLNRMYPAEDDSSAS